MISLLAVITALPFSSNDLMYSFPGSTPPRTSITKSPAGAHQWKPKKNGHAIEMTPDAHDRSKKNLPMMQTTDLD